MRQQIDFQKIQFELNLNSCVKLNYGGFRHAAYLVSASEDGKSAIFLVHIGQGVYEQFTVSCEVVQFKAAIGRPLITHIWDTACQRWFKFDYYLMA